MKVEKTDAEWRERLTPEQYAVLRDKATERPWSGEHNQTKEPGVFRCAGCGAELRSPDGEECLVAWARTVPSPTEQREESRTG